MKKDNEDNLLKIGEAYYQYRKLLISVAYKYLHNIDTSEDAVQEAIVKILKYPNNIDFDDEIRTKNYFVRVVRNVAIDMCNKRSANSDTSLDSDPAIILTAHEDSNPEQYAITNESVNEIMNEIKKMDPKYSDVLKYLKKDELTIVQTAELMCVSKRTVSYRLEAALHILKEKLRKADK